MSNNINGNVNTLRVNEQFLFVSEETIIDHLHNRHFQLASI